MGRPNVMSGLVRTELSRSNSRSRGVPLFQFDQHRQVDPNKAAFAEAGQELQFSRVLPKRAADKNDMGVCCWIGRPPVDSVAEGRDDSHFARISRSRQPPMDQLRRVEVSGSRETVGETEPAGDQHSHRFTSWI